MSHMFSQVPRANIPRSSFDRTRNLKTTIDAGYLYPVMVDLDVMPGDTVSMNIHGFCRPATPLVPIMDNLFLDTFFFFVPHRLVWDNWPKFLGEQKNPGDSTDFETPILTSTAAYVTGSLWDYLGLPLVEGFEHVAFASRSYNLIWNEWYRDQNLQNSVVVDVDDGPDTVTDYVLLKRGKRHDYFTSCLPWPQKGDAVTLPLGTEATVVTANTPVYIDSANSSERTVQLNATGDIVASGGTSGPTENIVWGATGTGLKVDLTTATAATINALREAFQLQKLYERDARGGTRHTEIIRSHFGVVSPDARLQRPEYLGGQSVPITYHPVAQNSATGATGTPQGNLAAFGTSSPRGGFIKSFTEHGTLICLANVRADLNYQQGLHRMWSRRTRVDYYWPALAHLGEQAVLNKEIYCQGTAGGTDDDGVFGYNERFAELRYAPNMITGKFRSTYATAIDQWHLAQEFASLPVLNSTFIQENPPMTRVMAVTTEPQFLLDMRFASRWVRPMPLYGVPGQIDRF